MSESLEDICRQVEQLGVSLDSIMKGNMNCTLQLRDINLFKTFMIKIQDFLESKLFQPRKDTLKVSSFYYKPLTSRSNLKKKATNIKSLNKSIGSQTHRFLPKKPEVFDTGRQSHPVNRIVKFIGLRGKAPQRKETNQVDTSIEPRSELDEELQKLKLATEPKIAVDQIMTILRQKFNLTKSDLINLLNSEEMREDALVSSNHLENRQRLHL